MASFVKSLATYTMTQRCVIQQACDIIMINIYNGRNTEVPIQFNDVNILLSSPLKINTIISVCVS